MWHATMLPIYLFIIITNTLSLKGKCIHIAVYSYNVLIFNWCKVSHYRTICHCSVMKSCMTLCNPMDCSIPGSSVLHCLPEFAQFMSISSSAAPFSFCPQSFPASGSFFSNESAVCLRRPKYWRFSFSISPSNENSGLISFRIDWFDFLGVKGLSRVSSSITVRKHQFFSTQPSLWPWYNFIHILSDLHSSQWS